MSSLKTVQNALNSLDKQVQEFEELAKKNNEREVGRQYTKAGKAAKRLHEIVTLLVDNYSKDIINIDEFKFRALSILAGSSLNSEKIVYIEFNKEIKQELDKLMIEGKKLTDQFKEPNSNQKKSPLLKNSSFREKNNDKKIESNDEDDTLNMANK